MSMTLFNIQYSLPLFFIWYLQPIHPKRLLWQSRFHHFVNNYMSNKANSLRTGTNATILSYRVHDVIKRFRETRNVFMESAQLKTNTEYQWHLITKAGLHWNPTTFWEENQVASTTRLKKMTRPWCHTSCLVFVAYSMEHRKKRICKSVYSVY